MISRTTHPNYNRGIGQVRPVPVELVREVDELLVAAAIGKHERRRDLMHGVYGVCGDERCWCADSDRTMDREGR